MRIVHRVANDEDDIEPQMVRNPQQQFNEDGIVSCNNIANFPAYQLEI